MSDTESYKGTPETLKDEILQQQIEKNKGKAEALLKDKDKMEQFLERLERKLEQVPYAGKYLADVPILISMVKAYIEKKYTDVPIGTILAIVGALIYFLSPVDLIPDVIPGVGILDDAAVIAFALKFVHDDIKDYKEWRVAQS
ncbi:MAG TPA: YkvA family protein [Eubacteriales bacterium]|nr:YkvA family protein [Eubacteriales bacterium]